MAYTMFKKNSIKKIGDSFEKNTLEYEALSFIRESCEGMRFDCNKSMVFGETPSDNEGKSISPGQIPYNMEKDIDRLCLENAIERFLKSGKKEDAFDVYFCYLEMFVGDYEKTRRMIELLSEFEAVGSGLLMKHRDHYSHSVYVFTLGLAIYQSNSIYRETYKKFYSLEDEKKAAAHFLQYWGLSALFHDIGYPFELPFEQVCSYFEVGGEERKNHPFLAYQGLDKFIVINEPVKAQIESVLGEGGFDNTNKVFAHEIYKKVGASYNFTKEDMLGYLTDKPIHPDKFGYFMDHAYFSSTVLFKKLFEEMEIEVNSSYLDALTAILMHNSLYKFCIAHYKDAGNVPFKAALHPLAYMLMICDELQCWDRTAYGRNSKKELHPMGCSFDFSDNQITAVYLYDEAEMAKVNTFKDEYIGWLQNPGDKKAPGLKAYSGMFIKKNGISDFQADIERIVDLSEIKLNVDTGLTEHVHVGNRSYLSDSNFINLYNFAVILNGRWGNSGWKKARDFGQEEAFLNNEKVIEEFTESFKKLSLEYKLSNINQAKAFAKYMNEIGCFYTDKSVDFELVDMFTDEELLRIGKLEHLRWLQEHYDMGWTYGEPEKSQREFLREHKDMIPDFDGFGVSKEKAAENYDRLDKATQDKDTEPMECMLAMLKLFDGLRIYRL